ncbi:MAG: hypothetical protein ACYDG6_11485 [Thermincolia bacterium]
MKALYKFTALALVLFLGGCTDKSLNTGNPGTSQVNQEWLAKDALMSFRETVKADYTRLTIITGSLKKLPSTDAKERTLGLALGAIEATIFSTPYEYQRLSDNENITVEIKKALAPPGLLKVLTHNQYTLEHIYENILKPLAQLQDSGQPLTITQQKSLDKTTENINIIAESYKVLIREYPKPSKQDIQEQINTITNAQKELEKLGL